MQPADQRLTTIQCLSADQAWFYDVTYVVQDGTRIRLLTSSIRTVRRLSLATADEGARVFLSFIASAFPYESADPDRVQEWVRANVRNSGARLIVAGALFEIDPKSPDDAEQSYRLNLVGRGAVP